MITLSFNKIVIPFIGGYSIVGDDIYISRFALGDEIISYYVYSHFIQGIF